MLDESLYEVARPPYPVSFLGYLSIAICLVLLIFSIYPEKGVGYRGLGRVKVNPQPSFKASRGGDKSGSLGGYMRFCLAKRAGRTFTALIRD